MELLWYDLLQEDGQPLSTEVLSPERRARALAMGSDIARRRTVAGETLARQALAKRLGCSPQEAPLRWTEEGKPEAPDTGLYVSISHSGPYVVCAVGERPIGVDIETLRPADERVMGRMCTEAELSYLRRGDSDRRFWELWTAKEALFKLTGQGPLRTLSALAPPPGVAVCYQEHWGCALTVVRAL